MIEAIVEHHLCRQVKARGGEVRKVQWIGRRGAPDRLVLLPDRAPTYVELKRPKNGRVEAHQAREHDRMRRFGAPVEVLTSQQEIDQWLTA